MSISSVFFGFYEEDAQRKFDSCIEFLEIISDTLRDMHEEESADDIKSFTDSFEEKIEEKFDSLQEEYAEENDYIKMSDIGDFFEAIMVYETVKALNSIPLLKETDLNKFSYNSGYNLFWNNEEHSFLCFINHSYGVNFGFKEKSGDFNELANGLKESLTDYYIEELSHNFSRSYRYLDMSKAPSKNDFVCAFHEMIEDGKIDLKDIVLAYKGDSAEVYDMLMSEINKEKEREME